MLMGRVGVLAGIENTAYHENQAMTQTNHQSDVLAFNEANFQLILSENVRFRKKIEELQSEIIRLYKQEILYMPPKMVVVKD
jgi:hypothetical protein